MSIPKKTTTKSSAARKSKSKTAAKKARPKRTIKKATPKRSKKKSASQRTLKKKSTKQSGKKKAVKRTADKASSKRKSHKRAPKKSPNSRSSIKRNNKASNSCYFTTACCDYYGLPDNCLQLETLRNFRDNIMSKTPHGLELIKKYYEVAPGIVAKIVKSPNRHLEFEAIFYHINHSCGLIISGNYTKAIKAYSKMVNMLISKYLNN